MMRTLYCTALFALTTVAQAAPSARWRIGTITAARNCSAMPGRAPYVFATTHAQVDADGAPNAITLTMSA